MRPASGANEQRQHFQAHSIHSDHPIRLATLQPASTRFQLSRGTPSSGHCSPPRRGDNTCDGSKQEGSSIALDTPKLRHPIRLPQRDSGGAGAAAVSAAGRSRGSGSGKGRARRGGGTSRQRARQQRRRTQRKEQRSGKSGAAAAVELDADLLAAPFLDELPGEADDLLADMDF